MFGTVLTVTFTALLAYVLWRAASVPQIARRASRKGIVILGGALWLLFFLGRAVGHDGTGPVAAVLELIGMSLLGWVFLVSLASFAVDLATVFGRVLRSWVSTLRGGALVAGTLLAGVALVQGHRAPEVVVHEVTLPSLPAELDGTVIVAASDAHLGSQLGEQWLAERVHQMEALRPDAVVFLGDMFEGHGQAPTDLVPLRRLSPRLGKWYVTGNHESHRSRRAGQVDPLPRAGFRRLANQWTELAPGLVLAGVSDLTQHRRRNLAGDPLAEALAGRPPGATVLLSHTPWQAERAAAAGVGLVLSGHTHGGQIWPFGYLVQIRYPLLAGGYEVAGMPIIVSRGIGTWGSRMRLWHRGEILLVKLRSRATQNALSLGGAQRVADAIGASGARDGHRRSMGTVVGQGHLPVACHRASAAIHASFDGIGRPTRRDRSRSAT